MLFSLEIFLLKPFIILIHLNRCSPFCCTGISLHHQKFYSLKLDHLFPQSNDLFFSFFSLFYSLTCEEYAQCKVTVWGSLFKFQEEKQALKPSMGPHWAWGSVWLHRSNTHEAGSVMRIRKLKSKVYLLLMLFLPG